MAWTDPREWVDGELVTAAIMNTHVRDNLNALKALPSDLYNVNEGSDYTTTSTSFVDVDATNLAMTITTTGGDVLITFSGSFSYTSTAGFFIYLDIHESVGSARLGGDDGMVTQYIATSFVDMMSINWLVQGLSAAEHTFKLQWKVSAQTGVLYAGAGTSGLDVHPQLSVREL